MISSSGEQATHFNMYSNKCVHCACMILGTYPVRRHDIRIMGFCAVTGVSLVIPLYLSTCKCHVSEDFAMYSLALLDSNNNGDVIAALGAVILQLGLC